MNIIYLPEEKVNLFSVRNLSPPRIVDYNRWLFWKNE
jgi:hypothetical protein